MITPVMAHHGPLDVVTLVNESDEIVGQMDKLEAHRGEAKLHRACSVYLFRKKEGETQLLIQQRCREKIVGATQWANTICGNVRPSENYEQCAYRRLKEELGIVSVKVDPIYKFEYHLQCNEYFSEWEMDQVFFGWYEGEVKPNSKEVQNYYWVNWNELLQKEKVAMLKTHEFNTKEVDFMLKGDGTPYHCTLAPWFVWMMNDKNLLQKIQELINS